MTFTKEEQRILSEDTQDLYDRYMKVTTDYEKSSSFTCKTVAILTSLAATVGACIDDLIEEGKEEEACEVVMSMILDVLKTIKNK